MRPTFRYMCIVFFLLGPWLVYPILAEVQKQSSPKQESIKEDSGKSKPAVKRLYRKPVPFAYHEKALKNSEQWKTMSPEERTEAMDKIEQARERFRKNEIERQKQILPLLKRRPIRSQRAVPSPDELPEAPVEGVR